MPLKQCSDCGQLKPIDLFHKNKKGLHGRHSCCKDCSKEYYIKTKKERRIKFKAYYEENKDRILLHNRAVKRGITIKDYKRILESQNGVCAICSIREKLDIDHCHNTGKVRGLLCGPCNRALGFLNDDIERLKRGIEYLSKFTELMEQCENARSS